LKRCSNAAPDPAYHFDVDPDLAPDPSFQFDADPDPGPQYWIKVKIMASVIQSSKCSFFLDILLANADMPALAFRLLLLPNLKRTVSINEIFLFVIFNLLLNLLFYIFLD
jgi:hypothetical protein